MTPYVLFLFLHVLTAILAFGTAMLAFPIIGAFGQKEPAHFNFALRLNHALGRRAVTPLAIATFAFGLLLVVLGNWDPFRETWLGVSIALFLVTVVDAQLFTLPAVGRLAQLTSSPSGEAAGQSPEVERLMRKVRIGGSISALLLVVITLLMVWKPVL